MTYSSTLKPILFVFTFIAFALAVYASAPAFAHAVTPPFDGCIDLTHNQYIGVSDAETNGEVSELQEFLRLTGDFTYPEITGYFGPATEQAVQRWQARNGVVSSGSPDTTGYGLVGPQTREAMRCGGDDPGTTGFSVSPTSGDAPFSTKATVTISSNDFATCGPVLLGTIEWGDGHVNRPSVLGCSGQTIATADYTYQDAGTYTVTFTANTPSETTITRTVVVGEDDDDVGGSLSASPTSGEAPLTVTFEATPSNATFFGGYRLFFGDGNSVQCGMPGGGDWTCDSKTHTYQSDGLYPVRLVGVGEGSGNQTIDTMTISVGEDPDPDPDEPRISITSPGQDLPPFDHGQTMEVSWNSTDAPSESKVRLEVWPAGSEPAVMNSDAGIASQTYALPTTGVYDWTIPSADAPEIADAGFRSRLSSGAYFILAKLYTGDECWGFCAPSAGEKTIHATAESAPFIIGSETDDPDDPPICPAVCVPMYEIQSGSCVYNSCGSGCGPNGETTFGTLQQCNQVVLEDHANENLAITSPSDGATVSGTVSIQADLVDDTNVASVRFVVNNPTIGGTQIERIATDPYTTSWDTTAVPDGRYTIIADARDASFESVERVTIRVTVANDNSGVSGFSVGDRVTNPEFRLSVRSQPSLSGARTGAQTVGSSGTIIGGPVTADGYTWWQIRWGNGMTGWSVQEYLAAHTQSHVSITSPSDNETISGTIDIRAAVSTDEDINFVRFVINNAAIGGTLLERVSAAPYSTTWDTTEVANGVYHISVTPRDASGITDRARVRVIVANDGAQVGSFSIGDRVTNPAARLMVRAQPGIGSERTGVQNIGSVGTIIGGPVPMADGYTWWQIRWDDGTVGWSVAEYLASSAGGTNDDEVGNFDVNSRVSVTAARLSVRAQPSLAAGRTGVQTSGSLGTIVGGPRTANGYTWWRIRWDNGMRGWSVQEYLSISNQPAPVPPTTSDDVTGGAPSVGNDITTTMRTVVYGEPILINAQSVDFVTPVATQPVGAEGTVIDGPVTMGDGNTWWEIRWDSGVRGWSTLDQDVDSMIRGSSNSSQSTGEVTTTSFVIGDRVTNTARMNIYLEPILINARSLEFVTPAATQPVGAEGTIMGRPVAMQDGNRWQQIRWDSGITGWSVQNDLVHLTE